MQISFRPVRALFLAALVAGAFSAIAAGSASASVASWSPSGSTKWTSSSITLYDNGGSPVACTPSFGWSSGTASSEGGLILDPSNFGEVTAKCGSSTFTMTAIGYGWKEGTSFGVTFTPETTLARQSPFGSYYQEGGPTGAFKNGSGSTQSTVTFNHARVGKIISNGHELSISGTFTVTTGTGGLQILK